MTRRPTQGITALLVLMVGVSLSADRIRLRSGKVLEGSFIGAELLLRARKAGAVMIQMGVDYFPRTRGRSKLSSLGVIAAILREMAGQWRELR